MSTKAQEELKERILAERSKGNIVFQAMPGEFMSANLEAFVRQPADGMLYDLNRLEEIALTFLHESKWVNDFAVAMVIRRLAAQRDEAEAKLAEERSAARGSSCDNALPGHGSCDAAWDSDK